MEGRRCGSLRALNRRDDRAPFTSCPPSKGHERWCPSLVDDEAEIVPLHSIKLMLAWETCCRSETPSPQSPLFVANSTAALGSGILFSYPELATIAGVQGVVIYAFASAAPMLLFGALGPIIRRKCPEGFVLTEWTRQRFGTVAMLYLSFMTLVTLFLYMISELSAVGQVVNLLTGLDGLPVIIVQVVVTTIYTCKCSPFHPIWKRMG